MQQAAAVLSAAMQEENGVEGAVEAFYRHLPLESMLCDISLFRGQRRLAQVYCPDCGLKMTNDIAHALHAESPELHLQEHRLQPCRYKNWAPPLPGSVAEGLVQGFGGFVHEVTGGVADVLYDPLHGIYREGWQGAAAGLSTGLRSLVRRPWKGGNVLLDKMAAGVRGSFSATAAAAAAAASAARAGEGALGSERDYIDINGGGSGGGSVRSASNSVDSVSSTAREIAASAAAASAAASLYAHHWHAPSGPGSIGNSRDERPRADSSLTDSPVAGAGAGGYFGKDGRFLRSDSVGSTSTPAPAPAPARAVAPMLSPPVRPHPDAVNAPSHPPLSGTAPFAKTLLPEPNPVTKDVAALPTSETDAILGTATVIDEPQIKLDQPNLSDKGGQDGVFDAPINWGDSKPAATEEKDGTPNGGGENCEDNDVNNYGKGDNDDDDDDSIYYDEETAPMLLFNSSMQPSHSSYSYDAAATLTTHSDTTSDTTTAAANAAASDATMQTGMQYYQPNPTSEGIAAGLLGQPHKIAIKSLRDRYTYSDSLGAVDGAFDGVVDGAVDGGDAAVVSKQTSHETTAPSEATHNVGTAASSAASPVESRANGTDGSASLAIDSSTDRFPVGKGASAGSVSGGGGGTFGGGASAGGASGGGSFGGGFWRIDQLMQAEAEYAAHLRAMHTEEDKRDDLISREMEAAEKTGKNPVAVGAISAADPAAGSAGGINVPDGVLGVDDGSADCSHDELIRCFEAAMAARNLFCSLGADRRSGR